MRYPSLHNNVPVNLDEVAEMVRGYCGWHVSPSHERYVGRRGQPFPFAE